MILVFLAAAALIAACTPSYALPPTPTPPALPTRPPLTATPSLTGVATSTPAETPTPTATAGLPPRPGPSSTPSIAPTPAPPGMQLRVGPFVALDGAQAFLFAPPGALSTWDGGGAVPEDVIRVGDELWLYYTGSRPGYPSQIGLATSADGLTWTRKLDAPVFTVGPPGSWDSAYVMDPAVLYDPETGLFEMWYVAAPDADLYSIGFGYATSQDGINWTRASDRPVIIHGEPGAWNEERIGGLDVVKVDGLYYLYYAATKIKPFRRQIGCATSADGLNWAECPGNPLLSPNRELAPFEGKEVEEPNLVYHEGLWLMAYTGYLGPQGDEFRIGLARSTDGLRWERLSAAPVIGRWPPRAGETTAEPVLYLDPAAMQVRLWYTREGGWTGHAAAVLIPPPPPPSVEGTDPTRNRLLNPGFERPARRGKFSSIQVTEEWEPFYCDTPYTAEKCPAERLGDGNPADLLMARPEYWPTDLASRVHSGLAAQHWLCPYNACRAGVYQTFRTNPGEVCEVGAWVQSWSAYSGYGIEEGGSLTQPYLSELNTQDARDSASWIIRVDPTGGRFAWASHVLASRPFGYEHGIYDQYVKISFTFTATSEQAAVFFENLRLWPLPHNDNYLDDAYAYCSGG